MDFFCIASFKNNHIIIYLAEFLGTPLAFCALNKASG